MSKLQLQDEQPQRVTQVVVESYTRAGWHRGKLERNLPTNFTEYMKRVTADASKRDDQRSATTAKESRDHELDQWIYVPKPSSVNQKQWTPEPFIGANGCTPGARASIMYRIKYEKGFSQEEFPPL